MKQSPDSYTIVRRIDWIRGRLLTGKPLNSTDIVAEFNATPRTAHRDIRYLREFYGDRIQYDYRERTFYLK